VDNRTAKAYQPHPVIITAFKGSAPPGPWALRPRSQTLESDKDDSPAGTPGRSAKPPFCHRPRLWRVITEPMRRQLGRTEGGEASHWPVLSARDGSSLRFTLVQKRSKNFTSNVSGRTTVLRLRVVPRRQWTRRIAMLGRTHGEASHWPVLSARDGSSLRFTLVQKRSKNFTSNVSGRTTVLRLRVVRAVDSQNCNAWAHPRGSKSLAHAERMGRFIASVCPKTIQEFHL
jgi:hypothetical protein